ncbi:MAG: hypothetical protein M1598_08120 [Actinobacteria bacterium]|nr:hypothetical protein [Actinomycetota bacterium]
MGAVSQVNSQSQSGCATFGLPVAVDPNVNDPDGKIIHQHAKAKAQVKKKVKTRVTNTKKSNGQGQGQITQADFIIQVPTAVNVAVDYPRA